MLEGIQRQRFGEMICNKLKENFFFDDFFPPTKENRLKIASVFENFVKHHKLVIENLELSENAIESLKDIYEMYQIDLCAEYGISRNEHAEFCKLIDECINNNIEKFKQNKKRGNECLKDSERTEITHELSEKLKEAEHKRQKNLFVVSTLNLDEQFINEARKYYICEDLQEEQRRGFVVDWWDLFLFTSKEEVQFILDHWTRVFTITTFIDRFSFKDLLSLEHEDRKIVLQNSNNIALLFEYDKEITCDKMMSSSIATRNLMIKEAKQIIALLDLLNESLEIIKHEPNEELDQIEDDEQNPVENSLEEDVQQHHINFQNEEEDEIQKGEIDDMEDLWQPKPITIEDLLKCTHEQLTLFIKFPERLKVAIRIRDVPFDSLIEYDQLPSLFQSPCDKNAINFLEKFSSINQVFWIAEEDLLKLSEKEKMKLSEYWFEFQKILSIVNVDIKELFVHVKTEDIDLMIDHADKISGLMQTDELINIEDFSKFLKGAIELVNHLEEEQVKIIEKISEKTRYYILENSHSFQILLLTTDWKLEDLKEMPLELIKDLIEQQLSENYI